MTCGIFSALNFVKLMISGEMWNQSWRDFYGLRYNIFAFSKKSPDTMNEILRILRWWWERTTHRAALGPNVGENDLKCDKFFSFIMELECWFSKSHSCDKAVVTATFRDTNLFLHETKLFFRELSGFQLRSFCSYQWKMIMQFRSCKNAGGMSG